MISEPTACSVQPCTYLASSLTIFPKGPKWVSIWPTSPRRSIRCGHKDFHARGTFGANHAPEFHQVCPKRFPSLLHVQWKLCTYLVSRLALSPKRPKWASIWPMSFKEFHQVYPKWFSSLLHVLRKPRTYLAWRLTLSPNRPKRASIWPTSSRRSIGCG
jgi:hypothetical protein